MSPTQIEIAEQGREAAAKLAAAEQRLADYDPAHYEWFDGETEIQESFEWHLHNNVRLARQELTDLRAEYRATLVADWRHPNSQTQAARRAAIFPVAS